MLRSRAFPVVVSGWDMRLSVRKNLMGWLLALCAALSLFACPVARALDVELDDVAPDRVERQRAYTRGQLPLPSTPDLGRLNERLAEKGLVKGRPIFIRIFKATSELEIWMQGEKEQGFVLLDTYPICHWTGTLGPKLREGDKQSPEGFYSVSVRQMRLVGRWQKAFNIGFPNPHDQLNKRTGSFILVHGGCSSVGCFAMTEQVQEEIFELAKAAVTSGQDRFHIHIYPFRMSEENLAAHASNSWVPFWRDLKAGYDSFERTKLPPRIAICEQRYHVTDAEAGDVSDSKPMSILRPSNVSRASGAAPTCVSEPQQRAAVKPAQTVAGAKDATKGQAKLQAVSLAETDAEIARPLAPKKPLTSRRASPGSRAAVGAKPVSSPEIANGFGSSPLAPEAN